MFDAVLRRSDGRRGRLGTGALLSLAVHAAVLPVAIWMSTRKGPDAKPQVDVTFFAAAAPAPPPPPPPPPAAGGTKPKPKVETPKRPVKNDTIVRSKQEPTQKPPEAEPPKEEPKEGGALGGVEGGVAGGVVGGTVGGTIGGVIGGQVGGTPGGTGTAPPPPPQNTVMAFGEGMTRPSRVGGAEPVYTREALTAKVEGTMLVKCVIQPSGQLTHCRILKPLPHMEQAVLSALSTWRMTPVTYQGRAVAVEYVIPIRLQMK